MSEAKLYPTVVHMLIDAATTAPDREALIAGEERLNYRQFLNCVIGFSNELENIDITNERVALVMGTQ